jgi:hypothetical protein
MTAEVEMASAILARVKDAAWTAYTNDPQVCGVCVRIGAVLTQRATYEEWLASGDLSEADRNEAAAALAATLAIPLPTHEVGS